MKAMRRRGGQTLLELIAATLIITIALVPALKLTRSRIANTELIQQAETRLTFCTSKLEEELALTASRWDLSSQTGAFSGPGLDNLRFAVSKSDAVAAGGIPDALAAIEVTVWHDEDGNGNLDQAEKRVRLATKIAKLLAYENESSAP